MKLTKKINNNNKKKIINKIKQIINLICLMIIQIKIQHLKKHNKINQNNNGQEMIMTHFK